ncbi:MAG: nucleotidyltransferase domain-containing protein, partial [Anaerolineae bacterium]|nr:nucleotidyltransferase domain-containing protein [Anaerolineae bacterium]
VRRVYLFGSVTRPGAFRPDSDVDIGLEGANMALCFDVWRELERAAPAWRLDVRSLEPEDLFTERVRQKGEVVYEQPASDP